MRVLIIVLLSTLALQFVEASVDGSRPNISGFKLRHVDVEKEALERAQQVIRKLSDGAIIMKESLFVDANYVKCPAYAQLFKLILSQENNSSVKIRESVIQSLAIVVTYDRVFYYKLFLSSLPTTTQNFLEAVKELEKNTDENPKAQEAWLDLIGCLFEYMMDNQVVGYLNEPARAKALNSMKKFMSIPVDSEQTPAGLVSNLIKRFNNNNPIVDKNAYEEARKVIVTLEDEETHKQRVEYEQSSNNKDNNQANSNNKDKDTLNLEDDKKKKPTVATVEEMKNFELEKEIDVTVPTNINSNSNSKPSIASNNNNNNKNNNNNNNVNSNESGSGNGIGNGKPFSLDQLAILKFIKMRFENQTKRSPRLSMRLAFDFNSHWEILLESKLDSSTDVGLAAQQFRQDKKNIAHYDRVRKVIADYMKIMEVLSDIKALNTGRMYSVAEFGIQIEKLNKLMEKFDDAFDIDNLRRLQTLWKVKYREYSVMQKFIDGW